MNLWDKLMAPSTLASTMWQWEGASFRQRTYGEMIAEARHVAAGLRIRGVMPGSVVPAVITNGPDAITGVLGALFAGASVASLPIIARGMSIPAYSAQLTRLCELLGADFLLAEERFLVFMDAQTRPGVGVIGYRSLIDTDDTADISPPPLDATMLIQFSSGTTGEPHGVELSGDAIAAHLAALSTHLRVDPERDIGYTWLPLSHDMGLFGCAALAWYNGMPGVISTPERFLTSPRSWFDDCADFAVTVTAGPPFALDVAARAERARTSNTPLRLRLVLLGGETIAWDTLTDAVSTFGARGLTLASLTPAYGLAEATLAVTSDAPDEEPSYVDIAARSLAAEAVQDVDENNPEAQRCVCVGSPVPGVSIRLDHASREIIVRSDSLASRYFGDPELTRRRFRDGELHTGDHGFEREGRLFITGREDDLLVVAGRNVHAGAVEQRLGQDPAVRSGNCAIVREADARRPQTVLVAETGTVDDARALASRLHRAAMEQAGLPIHDFVFVAPGTFPKTPSGKVQRHRCRELVADDTVGTRISLSRLG